MCVVSMIGDEYSRRDGWPWRPVYPAPPPPQVPEDFGKKWREFIERQDADEIADLKKRVAALEELLRQGKQYDDETGQSWRTSWPTQAVR